MRGRDVAGAWCGARKCARITEGDGQGRGVGEATHRAMFLLSLEDAEEDAASFRKALVRPIVGIMLKL